MLRNPEKYKGSFNGRFLEINGVRFGALVIPYSENLPASVAEFADKSKGFPVIFVNDYPERFLKDDHGRIADTCLPDWKKHACTVRRDQLNYPSAPFDFMHDAMEPSGMFGKIQFFYCDKSR